MSENCPNKMTQEEWLRIGSKWKNTGAKTYVLFPAIDSIMGDISNKKILDAGCGDGTFVRRCTEKGAKTVGIDISPGSIEGCKESDPSGDYQVMDVKNMSLDQKFDYVLSLFVLLSFDKKDEIIKAIKNMSQNLNEEGKLIIAVPHPAFEESDNSETMKRSFPEEYAYTKKGLETLYKHKTKEDVAFTDFHWMIEDYAECIRKSGLIIEDIREPLPIPESKNENPSIYDIRVKYPIMVIFVCSSSQ